MTASDNTLTLKYLELDTLLDITNAINRQPDEQSLLKIFLFTLVANFKIDHLLVCSKERGSWFEVLKHGLSPNFSFDMDEMKEIGSFTSITSFKQTTFTLRESFDVAIPVARDGRNIATILLGGKRKIGEEGDKESLKFIQTISNIIVVAVQNIRLNQRRMEQQAIKKEMELAKHLQGLLFPQNLPTQGNLNIFADYIPQLLVGGDYFDFIKLSNSEFVICIADVSGKGIAAAFIMSNVQAALRILTKQGMPLEHIVRELNMIIFNNTRGEKFVTFFIARYVLSDNKLFYINCGHNAPVFYNSLHHFQMLDKGTLILGAFERLPSIETGTIDNINDSLLFCYTDGLVESFEKTDTDQAITIIKQIIKENMSLATLNEEVLEKLNVRPSAMDDITVLSCSLKSSGLPI